MFKRRRWQKRRKRGNRMKPNQAGRQAGRQESSLGGHSGESLGVKNEGLGARCLVPSLVRPLASS